MYLTMAGLQLHLPQAIALPSRPMKEATLMDKMDFNAIGPSNQQKGDS
jgi:hypothetical protein